jgi:hypothetical protein
LGGLAVHVDRVGDQLDGAKDEAYPIGDLHAERARVIPTERETISVGNKSARWFVMSSCSPLRVTEA